MELAILKKVWMIEKKFLITPLTSLKGFLFLHMF